MRITVDAPEGRGFVTQIAARADVDAWQASLRALFRDLVDLDRTRCWGVAITIHADGEDCEHD